MTFTDFKQKLKKLWADILHIPDTPHAIALGAAVGLGWNFIPSLGVGPILSVLSAKAFKASGIAAITVNLGTGLFIPLLYSLNLIVGRTLTGQWLSQPEVEKNIQDSLHESLEGIEAIVEQPSRFLSLDRITEAGLEFFLGGIANAIIAGIIIYGLIRLPIYLRKRYSRS